MHQIVAEDTSSEDWLYCHDDQVMWEGGGPCWVCDGQGVTMSALYVRKGTYWDSFHYSLPSED